MEIDFRDALERLGRGAPVRIAREMPPAGAFNELLPEREEASYVAETGTMIIRSTMAGLAAMDSPYPPGGFVEASDFVENLAKTANEVVLNEKTQRMLQQRLRDLQLSGGNLIEAMVQEVLNFTNKVLVQPHLDTAEYLRAQALIYGKLDWTFNRKRLLVDYGVPADNFLPERTGVDAYHGAESKFWDDIRLIRRRLRYNLRGLWAHPDTIDAIVANPNNNLVVLAQDGFTFTMRKQIVDGDGRYRDSGDARDTVTLTAYQYEGEIVNPAEPDKTIIIPFMPTGKILAVAQNTRSGYRVGEGSTPDPEADRALGFTQIGPTVEANGATGRWADVFTPERRRYQLVGQAVTNLLPVIEAPDKIVVATTEMAGE